MDQDLSEALAAIGGAINAIDKKIDALGSRQSDATDAGGVEVPPGFVAVRPTGPKGAGKVRFWPALATDGKTTEGPWSYGNRMSTVIGESGQPLFQAGRNAIISMTASARGLSVPEACDFLTHPEDWLSQAELDRQAAERERDAGASWVAGS